MSGWVKRRGICRRRCLDGVTCEMHLAHLQMKAMGPACWHLFSSCCQHVPHWQQAPCFDTLHMAVHILGCDLAALPLQVFKALKGGVSEVAVKEICCIDVSQMHAFENEVALLQSLTFDRNIVQVGALLEGSANVGEQPAAAAAAPCLSVLIVLPALVLTQHIRQDMGETAPNCPGSRRLHALGCHSCASARIWGQGQSLFA